MSRPLARLSMPLALGLAMSLPAPPALAAKNDIVAVSLHARDAERLSLLRPVAGRRISAHLEYENAEGGAIPIPLTTECQLYRLTGGGPAPTETSTNVVGDGPAATTELLETARRKRSRVLDPGERRFVKVTFKKPQRIGTYRVRCAVDSGKHVPERYEDNNHMTLDFPVVPAAQEQPRVEIEFQRQIEPQYADSFKGPFRVRTTYESPDPNLRGALFAGATHQLGWWTSCSIDRGGPVEFTLCSNAFADACQKRQTVMRKEFPLANRERDDLFVMYKTAVPVVELPPELDLRCQVHVGALMRRPDPDGSGWIQDPHESFHQSRLVATLPNARSLKGPFDMTLSIVRVSADKDTLRQPRASRSTWVVLELASSTKKGGATQASCSARSESGLVVRSNGPVSTEADAAIDFGRLAPGRYEFECSVPKFKKETNGSNNRATRTATVAP